jgi:hypothetical protein
MFINMKIKSISFNHPDLGLINVHQFGYKLELVGQPIKHHTEIELIYNGEIKETENHIEITNLRLIKPDYVNVGLHENGNTIHIFTNYVVFEKVLVSKKDVSIIIY